VTARTGVEALDRLHRDAATTGLRTEELADRLALDDLVGDRVGLLLVGVAALADAPLEADASALLDDVRRLVGRGVQVGSRRERDVVAGRVGQRAHGRAGLGGCTANVCPDLREIVLGAERRLDLIEERQRTAGAGDAMGRGSVGPVLVERGIASALHGEAEDLGVGQSRLLAKWLELHVERGGRGDVTRRQLARRPRWEQARRAARPRSPAPEAARGRHRSRPFDITLATTHLGSPSRVRRLCRPPPRAVASDWPFLLRRGPSS